MASVNGLHDVIAAYTEISEVDGVVGKLTYRGHAVSSLVPNCTFEDVAFLLWTGHLPTPAEHDQLLDAFGKGRDLPEEVLLTMDALPKTLDVMNAVTIGLLSFPPFEGNYDVDQAVKYTAAFPVLVSRHLANQCGTVAMEPRSEYGHVANLLYLLKGELPTEEQVEALQAYMILTMEHSLNASAFAARVTTSTRAIMPRALASALMTMTGPLHGGAPSEVMEMFDAIRLPERAESWLTNHLQAGKRIMGFGHRVYRTTDPRATVLRDIAIRTCANEDRLALAKAIEQTAQDLLAQSKPDRALHTNVEYWAASVLESLHIPRSLFTAIFSASRIVGWSAHILEQKACDTLIRPKAVYVDLG